MITVFTPTYNRKECIRRLAESLLVQSNKNFEWVIVDDGSTDGTEIVIRNYQEFININYIYQNNSGKHVAYNKGIQQAKGNWFVCVDSDDILTKDAIEKYERLTCEEKSCIGFLLPQQLYGFNDKKKWNKISDNLINVGDLKYLYNITESNIIIKTCILSKYHFPVFFDEEGKQEKFCPEDVLYNKLVNEGKFRVVNDSVYISEYQQEGLTNSIFMLWKDNSNGVLDALKSRYSLFTEYNFIPRWVNRIKCVMNINALCMEKKKNIWLTSPSKPLSIILYMPSIFFRKLRFR